MSEKSDETKSKKIPLYAKGDYDRELNYKIWSTYKARFNAASRLHRKHELSTKALALLSGYLIIFSLITTLLPSAASGGSAQVLLFLSVSMSIIILVIGQLETAQDFSVRSHKYHRSGLEVSKLYKKLRALKTRYKDRTDETFLTEVEKLSDSYDDILHRSENHEDIDNLMFRASKPDYEDHNLKGGEVVWIKLRYYVGEFWFYYAAMILPPILFGIYVYISFS